MTLLAPIQNPELPLEALLARVRARRSRLVAGEEDGDPATSVDWLYARLEPRARRLLHPYLDLLATRWFCQVLRHRLAGDPLPPALQQPPLLDRGLLRVATTAGTGSHLIACVERELMVAAPWSAGLTETYLNQGPGGVEQQLEIGCLAYGARYARHRSVRRLLQQLLDMRNLLSVMRFWRWQVQNRPELGSGGTIPPRQLLRVWREADQSALARVARHLGTLSLPIQDPRQAERELMRGITKELGHERRNPLDIGVVLENIWQLQLAAVRRGLQKMPTEESDRLRAEGGLW